MPQLPKYSYVVSFRKVHKIFKPCCLKAVEARPLVDFGKKKKFLFFFFLFLSPRFCSNIDLQVNASFCCSVRPLISYCYVSADTDCFIIFLNGNHTWITSKIKRRKSNKKNLQSITFDLIQCLIGWLFTSLNGGLLTLVSRELFYSNYVPFYWSCYVLDHDYDVMSSSIGRIYLNTVTL